MAVVNGLTLVTLSDTFVLPIVTAVTHRNQLAALAALLGETPERVVLAFWNGSSLRGDDTVLRGVVEDVLLIADRHAHVAAFVAHARWRWSDVTGTSQHPKRTR